MLCTWITMWLAHDVSFNLAAGSTSILRACMPVLITPVWITCTCIWASFRCIYTPTLLETGGGWSRYWFTIKCAFLMTSVCVALLVRKSRSADSAGWTGLKRPCIAWLVQRRACNNVTNLLWLETSLAKARGKCWCMAWGNYNNCHVHVCTAGHVHPAGSHNIMFLYTIILDVHVRV